MRVTDIVELIVLAALWGASFLFMRIAAPVLGPVWLIEIRVVLAGLALLPLLIRLNIWTEVRRQAIPLFIVGCLNSAIPFLCFAFASVSLPAGFNSILNATVPLFASVVAAIWLKEKFTIERLIGFCLGFAGVVVLVGWEKLTIATSLTTMIASIGAGLTASLLYACMAPYIKWKLSDLPPIAIATMSLFSAAIFLLPALPFTAPKSFPSAIVLQSVLALALFSTASAYLLFFRLIQNIGSTKALTVAYLIPLFAVGFAAIFLKETITSSMVFGGGLILLGTSIANDLFKRKQIDFF